MASVTLVAVTVDGPTTAELMVPVVCPFASVGAPGWVMTSIPPLSVASVTVLPGTGLHCYLAI